MRIRYKFLWGICLCWFQDTQAFQSHKRTTHITSRTVLIQQLRGGAGSEQAQSTDDETSKKELSASIEEVVGSNESKDTLESNTDPELTRRSTTDPDSTDAAQIQRSRGKSLHDAGDYTEAAEAFAQAAQLCDGDDYATCRLHQALCRLKSTEYDLAQTICDELLQRDDVAPPLRARAFYRRAKAKLELDQDAIEDARHAAFLGDSKGVSLYGKLLREQQQPSSDSLPSTDFSSSLFESILAKSSPSETPDAASSRMNPSSMLSSIMMGNGSTDGGGLAQSVLQSLSKRLDDESTQDTICEYLQSASAPQLTQWSTMAGIPLAEPTASRIANILQSITKKRLRRTVRWTKRGVYVVRVLRRALRVVSKYRNLLVLYCVCLWAKSAVLRPMPVKRGTPVPPPPVPPPPAVKKPKLADGRILL